VRAKVVIDTNIYIAIFNSGLYERLRNPLHYVVYLAYPVLHELWIGATGKHEVKHLGVFQARFIQLNRLIIPTAATLSLIGQACHYLRRTGKLDPVYPKHYNDIAIAASARQVGATVLTNNLTGFQVIQEAFAFEFETPQ